MARTSTRTPARAAMPQPWPRRREREGGVAPRVDGAATDRPPVVRPGSIPQQRPVPASPPQRPDPDPAPRPGAVAPERPGNDMSPEDLLASVPPFGTPPYGTGRSTSRPPAHPAAAEASPQGTRRPAPARNGFGITALCLALVGLPFALVPPGGIVAAPLGAIAVVFGLLGSSRARRGVATNRTVSVIGTGLGLLTLGVGVAALVILFRASGASSDDGPYRLADLLPALSPAGADVSTGPAVTGPGFTFRLSGNAPGATVMWSVGGTSGVDQAARLPWDRTVPGRSDGVGSTALTAYTNPGAGGDLTCSMVTEEGRVLDSRTARPAGGTAGSAAVSCTALG